MHEDFILFVQHFPSCRIRVEPGGAPQHGSLAICRTALQGLDSELLLLLFHCFVQ